MKSVIASVVALFALPLASADYISGSIYMGASCNGDPFANYAFAIGCQSQPETGTSYALDCAASTYQTYGTLDCSGVIIDSSPIADSPCVYLSGNGTSMQQSCKAADFVTPTPAVNEVLYNGVSTCPPTGGDLTSVVSYLCGTCISANGVAVTLSCDAKSATASYWYGDECKSGDPDGVTEVLEMGCDDEVGVSQVMVTTCDTANSSAAVMKTHTAAGNAKDDIIDRITSAIRASRDTAKAATAQAKKIALARHSSP